MASEVTHVRKVLADLDRAGIHYVYLKNYQYLLESTAYTEKDIDLIITQGQFEAARDVFRSHGYLLFGGGVVKSATSLVHSVRWGIHIDHLYYFGTPYLSYHEILKNSIVIRKIRIPSDTYAATIMILNGALNELSKGRSPAISTEKRKKLRALSEVDRKLIERIVSRVVSKFFSRSFVEKMWNGEKFSFEFWLMVSFIRTMSFSRICRMFCKLFSRGKIVAFIGPDGVGKTTIIDNLVQTLNQLGVSSTQVYMGYWSHSLIGLQTVSRAKSIKRLAKYTTKKRASGFLIGIREILFTIDMLLKYFFILFPKSRRHQFAFTDRYFYDLLLNPRTTWYLKLASKLYPAPDILIYLHAAPETIFSRKAQHTVEQTTMLQQQFQEIVSKKYAEKNIIIDTEKAIKKVTKDILDSIA